MKSKPKTLPVAASGVASLAPAAGAAAESANPTAQPLSPSPAESAAAGQVRHLLVVEDEPDLRAMAHEVLGAHSTHWRVHVADSRLAARKMVDLHPIDLMLTDLQLPDGDGLDLLADLRAARPAAAAVVMSGLSDAATTLAVLRGGAIDFIPKPFDASQLTGRVAAALVRQQRAARDHRRLARLKSAVRQLNKARRLVGKKVDVLCNDLITAYGELTEQLGEVRVQESFRKTLETAPDLEQMLCHTMDWILKEAGYCNIAVWLAGEDEVYDLGAYMKYTVVGDKDLTAAVKEDVLPTVVRDGFIKWSAQEFAATLRPSQRKRVAGHELIASSCMYLGESLGALLLFRDAKCPFDNDDATMLQAVAPIFAATLAGIVHQSDDAEADDTRDDDSGENDYQSDYGPDDGPDDGENSDDESDDGESDDDRNNPSDFDPSAEARGRGRKGKSPRSDHGSDNADDNRSGPADDDDAASSDPPRKPQPPRRPRRKAKKQDAADWWKRGELPPF